MGDFSFPIILELFGIVVALFLIHGDLKDIDVTLEAIVASLDDIVREMRIEREDKENEI